MKNNKLLFILILFLLALSIIIISTSCSCFSCSKGEEAEVPIDVLEKADAFIISKAGAETFEKYITPNFLLTKHTPPYYEMVYKYYIPEKPYVNGLIKFSVDSVGNIVKERDITGIPNCRYSPEECEYTINEEQARQIAVENGMEPGIKDWKVGFIWNPQMKRYVWDVLSTLTESEGEYGYRGSGKEIVIDPTSGEVLAFNDWKIN